MVFTELNKIGTRLCAHLLPCLFNLLHFFHKFVYDVCIGHLWTIASYYNRIK